MKKLFVVLIIIGFAATANAGLFDKIQDAAKDVAGQSVPKQETPAPAKTEGAGTSGQDSPAV